VTHVVLRTYNQLIWLDSRLGNEFKNKIIPSCPEAPNSSMITESDHVEKKRKQIERYFFKLLEIEEFAQNEDLRKFLVTPVVIL